MASERNGSRSGSTDSNSCAICFKYPISRYRVPCCPYYYCFGCIKAWVELQTVPQCPFCLSEIQWFGTKPLIQQSTPTVLSSLRNECDSRKWTAGPEPKLAPNFDADPPKTDDCSSGDAAAARQFPWSHQEIDDMYRRYMPREMMRSKCHHCGSVKKY